MKPEKSAARKTHKKHIKKPHKPAGQIVPGLKDCPGLRKFRLDQLEPADYNPRIIDSDAMEGLKNSLNKFGCVEPIVVNTRGLKNIIIGGNPCPRKPLAGIHPQINQQLSFEKVGCALHTVWLIH